VITAIVQFKLPQPVSRQKAAELFSASAPNYRKVPGLVRKYYLVSPDGTSAGGVYLWKSREDAERLYSGEWKKTIEQRFGSAPSIAYFESPVIVDNVSGSIQAG
jgi:hypothetical protein